MTLKVLFTSAAVCVALTSVAGAADMQPVLKAPAAVDQQATGYVEVYSGFANSKASLTECLESECTSISSRINGWALGGAGRGNYWITHDVSVQVDAQAEGTSFNVPGQGHFSTQSYLVGGHWSWRNPQEYLFGIFAAAGDAGSSNLVQQRHGAIGAEAQWYWNQFTLYAQGGYDTTLGTVSLETDSINAWFIRGTGRYFINPNFLIEGTVSYANGNIDLNTGDPSIGFRTWTWGVKSEWRLPTAPFSIFAKYQGSDTKYDAIFDQGSFDLKVRDHRVLLGLKLHLGDKTLQQTDRAGATLDIMSPLADPTGPLITGIAGGI